MLLGNQLGLKMLEKGLVNKLSPTKRQHRKKFKCIKCGEPMVRVDNTNTMACSKCKNWFVFDHD